MISLLPLLALLSQIPAQDSRNTFTPDTDTHFKMPVYKTRAEWEARKAHLRKQILSSAGLLPMPPKTPLNANIYGRIENRDYSIEKVYLETMPGYYLGGNLYRPLGREGKFPGVISPHGHWNYGRLEDQPLASIPARCISLARQGYVVFAYDMVGYNDTVQTPHAFGSPREQLWSFGPLGLQLWNSIRALDFVEALPEVDRDRLAATGESGGGTQTFLISAVDGRVKAAAPVNMISAIMQGGSPCENAPGLRVGANNMEFGAMMAPRPLLMVSATGDWTRNTPREEYPAIQSIYELYARHADIETVQFDSPHNYHKDSREAVYRFFGKHLIRETDPKKLAERSYRVEKLQDMLVFHGRALPANALTYEQLFTQWTELARRQFEATTDPGELRERLALALGAELPANVLSERKGDAIVLSRAGKGDRVSGWWRPGTGPVYLVVDGRTPTPAGAGVLQVELFQTGSAIAPRNRSVKHFLTFNLSEDAHRVQDVLTAIAWLKSQGVNDIRLAGQGRSAVWLTFAAAVSPVPLKLEADLGAFAGSDEDFLTQFFVPGIQRAGGLRAALKLVTKN